MLDSKTSVAQKIFVERKSFRKTGTISIPRLRKDWIHVSLHLAWAETRMTLFQTSSGLVEDLLLFLRYLKSLLGELEDPKNTLQLGIQGKIKSCLIS